jgi:hypothetical protein
VTDVQLVCCRLLKVFGKTHCDTVTYRHDAGFAAIDNDDERRYVCHVPSILHHSLMLKRNSECYCITSESCHQFRPLISKLFSILLDFILECNLEDTDHPGPTTMNVQISSPERKTSEALILKKISRLVWEHHGSVKV